MILFSYLRNLLRIYYGFGIVFGVGEIKVKKGQDNLVFKNFVVY